MINWNLAEEAAKERADALSERLTEEQIDRIVLLLDTEANGESDAPRFGGVFSRTVPHDALSGFDREIEASEALFEGRLAAYLH
jgi:hypothetical protein